jgi:hypothetical protein
MTIYLSETEAAAMDREIDAWAALGLEGQLAVLIARDKERGHAASLEARTHG